MKTFLYLKISAIDHKRKEARADCIENTRGEEEAWTVCVALRLSENESERFATADI
jgi:hypothetical protein